MPVFQLTDSLVFPPADLAEPDGLLAVGGDLSEARLLLAYSMGIFPWYSQDSPILWWSPDPRLVLFPQKLKISRSLRQTIKKDVFEITFDAAFDKVIRACAETPRKERSGTWLTEEMISAYCGLHRSGYAHSVEAWRGDELAGGLYGVALGRAFFGESMFNKMSNASKTAFVRLVERLAAHDFKIIDCQITTGHLISLGAEEIKRREFIKILSASLKMDEKKGSWSAQV
jgi:leucyl/phenylalanyl-tRNA--protein transferase